MSLSILFHFLCTQHISDINISIIRNLRLCCWINISVVLFSVRCVLEIWCGWIWVVSVLQAVSTGNWTHVKKNYARRVGNGLDIFKNGALIWSFRSFRNKIPNHCSVSIQQARCWDQMSRQLCPHSLHIPKTAAATKTKGFFFLVLLTEYIFLSPSKKLRPP